MRKKSVIFCNKMGCVLGPNGGELFVMTVAVLFAREDSIYKTLPGCDVYDVVRDARTFAGGMPVVAHPPCRAWGRLRKFAKPRDDEKDLARWAVGQVRRWGGVLEHPESSTLWQDAGLPFAGTIDQHGGYTLIVEQFWWGHKARKRTWLYVCGIPRERVPAMPLVFGEPTHTISKSPGRRRKPGKQYKPQTTKAEREHTPIDFARWLVELAALTQQS